MSSRVSSSAGKRANHSVTAVSSWPGKIQRTSRLRMPSVLGYQVVQPSSLSAPDPSGQQCAYATSRSLRRSSASSGEPGLAWDHSLDGWGRHEVHIDHF